MNPLTQIKNTQKITKQEIELGLFEKASWHARFAHSAYVFAGGLDYELTEGDLLAVFAQYGELVDVHLVRDKTTGKSKGFAFLAYEDQRSTVLAVDNLSGATVAGRKIRVEHVDNYKKRKAELEGEEEDATAVGLPSKRQHSEGSREPRPESAAEADEYELAADRIPSNTAATGTGRMADAWQAPGSLFSLLRDAAPSAPAGIGTAARGQETGKEHKKHKEHKEHKKHKHKKEKKDRHRSRSRSPSRRYSPSRRRSSSPGRRYR